MLIDLSPLYANVVERISIDEEISFPEEYFKNTPIQGLPYLKVQGFLTKSDVDTIEIKLDATGEMELLDDISLEKGTYPFSFSLDTEIDEHFKKDENSLALLDVLWENIVLEIPLKFTHVEDLSKFHGDGWRLVSEESHLASENPFQELLKNLEEEE